MSDKHKLQVAFFFLILAVVAVLSFFILKTYLAALFLALIFFITFKPIHLRILKMTGNRDALAAFLTMTFIIIVIFIPLVFFGLLLFNDARDLYFNVISDQWQTSFATKWGSFVEDHLTSALPYFSFDLESYVSQILKWLIDHLDSVFSSFFNILINFFIMSLALFYLLKDGRHFKIATLSLSPLDDRYDQDIFNNVEKVVNSVVRGSLLVSIVKGFLTTIGFLFFGVPNAVFWGFISAIVSLIPGVGTGLVFVPALIYLFLNDHVSALFGLLIWGIFLVGLIDNILGPYLMKRGISIHPILILLSVIGGISLFGFVGFVAGPVALSLFFALLQIYPLVLKRE